MIPVWIGPVPIASMMRSATASPTATPRIHSAARLSVCPATAPTEITAAIDATKGCSCPNINAAADQARVAARAVCTTGQIPARNRPRDLSTSRRTTKDPPLFATARASEIAITPPLEPTRLRYMPTAPTNYQSSTSYTARKGIRRDSGACYQTVACLSQML